MKEVKTQRRLKIIRNTEDPKSLFKTTTLTPEEILYRLGRPRSLLSTSSKVEKGLKQGVLTRILYLTSSIYCPASTPSCRATCLGFTSGRMGYDRATMARDRRAALYAADTAAFLQLLREDLHQLCYDAETLGLKPACRINGSSDIPIELLHPEILSEFAGRVQFYDYTVLYTRMERQAMSAWKRDCGGNSWPTNYHLTFSAKENNYGRVERVLKELKSNVAMVFWPDLPADRTWLGYPVIDGDTNDLRFLDPSPSIVGLRAKGIAQQDLTGFVVRTDRSASTVPVLNRFNVA
ncbi:GP88 family protein [Aeoliella sp.]|uniref:GP88 family protein n=1 Tax=Aeoliella sp. TaxID=2795800 RepID=UPI003CCBD562